MAQGDGKQYAIALNHFDDGSWSLKRLGHTLRLMTLEEATAEIEHLIPAHGYAHIRLLKLVEYTFTADVRIEFEEEPQGVV